jgi:pimeloyl-ACP methyl ester carboxylesterase
MFTSNPAPTSRRRTVRLAAALAAAAACLPLVVASSASGQVVAARHPTSSVKPTIVLVHGAWADSSSWNGVIQRLVAAGYVVDAAPNPLRGLKYDSDYLAAYLSKLSGPIVLVGHSYGGAVITDAATGNPNVRALVYDDAYIPAEGEDVATLSGAQSALAPAGGNAASVFDLVPYPDPPAPTVMDTYLLPKVVFQDFAPDLPHQQAALLAVTQSPTSLAALASPSTAPAWTSIPSWDVVGRQDKIIPLAAQLSMAHRAGSQVTEIDSSHVSLISHPAAVAAVIVAAARATAS